MNNVEIAHVFDAIAKLLEAQGESPFKVRAYRRVVPEVAHLPELAQIAAEGRLRSVPGVGQEIEKKIDELLATGRLAYFDRLLAEFPAGFLELLDLPGVGPKLAGRLFKELGVGSIDDLERELFAGRIASLPRLGPKTVEHLKKSIEQHHRQAAPSR